MSAYNSILQPMAAPSDSRAGLYVIQVNNASSGSTEAPLHFLINQLDHVNQQYLISLPQVEVDEVQQPQLCNVEDSTSLSQYIYVNNQDTQVTVNPQSLQLYEHTTAIQYINKLSIPNKSCIESTSKEQSNKYLNITKQSNAQKNNIKTTAKIQTISNYVEDSTALSQYVCVNNQDTQVTVNPQSLQLYEHTTAIHCANKLQMPKNSCIESTSKEQSNKYLNITKQSNAQKNNIKATTKRQTILNYVEDSTALSQYICVNNQDTQVTVNPKSLQLYEHTTAIQCTNKLPIPNKSCIESTSKEQSNKYLNITKQSNAQKNNIKTTAKIQTISNYVEDSTALSQYVCVNNQDTQVTVNPQSLQLYEHTTAVHCANKLPIPNNSCVESTSKEPSNKYLNITKQSNAQKNNIKTSTKIQTIPNYVEDSTALTHCVCVNNQDNQVTVNPQSLQLYEHATAIQYANKLPIPNKSCIESTSKEQSNKYLNITKQSNAQKNNIKTTTKRQSIPNYVHIPDKVVPPKAIAVLPNELQMRRNIISPRRSLAARVRFGPLQGVSQKISLKEANILVDTAATACTPIFLAKRTESSVLYIDVLDKDKSNWLSLLPLGDPDTANVWVYEEGNELYGITTKPIASRTPLAIGYSKTYAAQHRLSSGPVLELQERPHTEAKQWRCCECQRPMGSIALLQRHMEVYHKADMPTARRRYRCSHCSRTFARLFTLKRHKLITCNENNDNRATPIYLKPSDLIRELQDTDPAPNVEESNRVPSDESFQNYTNGLDFSTNLFDTDRMPSLDMSGNSRSEEMFSSFAIGNNEDNCLATDTVSSKASQKVNNNKNNEKILVSCPYCNEVIVKEKRRQHILRDCRKRRFICKCGQVFDKSQKLANHIHKEHWEDLKSKEIKDSKPTKNQSSELPYTCGQCSHIFIRRGMLVNHLWRAHKLSTSVPLIRRVRHYPCAVCPKIYRTAAKRDRHVGKHHPGSEQTRASIEGEKCACEPAACIACPRQYATRAKLLQHMRATHPHLVPASCKDTIKSTSEMTLS